MPGYLVGRTFLETINIGADHRKRSAATGEQVSNIVGRKAGRKQLSIYFGDCSDFAFTGGCFAGDLGHGSGVLESPNHLAGQHI